MNDWLNGWMNRERAHCADVCTVSVPPLHQVRECTVC